MATVWYEDEPPYNFPIPPNGVLFIYNQFDITTG